MPLYDYSCKCGRTYEDIRPMESKESACECGEINEPEISGGHFMLTGGGWSGLSHNKIIPAKREPAKPPPTNYHNCTPESVHN